MAAGQAIEIRGLLGDVDGSTKVNAADRNAVVAVWTGSGYSKETDLDLSGHTNTSDRSVVISEWTASSCAP